VADIRKGWARAVVLAEKMAGKAKVEIDLTFPSQSGQKYITPMF